jgi:hypothetical protein
VPWYHASSRLLLRRQHVDELVELAVEEAPAALHVRIRLCALYCVSDADAPMPEFTQFDSTKSMMRNLPPKGTAGLARQSVRLRSRLPPGGLWELKCTEEPSRPLRLVLTRAGGSHEITSPWTFAPSVSDDDLFLFNGGKLHQGWKVLGANPVTRGGVAGVRFACWAPDAERVSVVGEFNHWDGRIHPMVSRGASGVWELFIPELRAGRALQASSCAAVTAARCSRRSIPTLASSSCARARPRA